jgi:hypothetical protein
LISLSLDLFFVAFVPLQASHFLLRAIVRNSGYHDLSGFWQLVIDFTVIVPPMILSFYLHDHVAILAALPIILGLVFVASDRFGFPLSPDLSLCLFLFLLPQWMNQEKRRSCCDTQDIDRLSDSSVLRIWTISSFQGFNLVIILNAIVISLLLK